jgi:hypothetical protein
MDCSECVCGRPATVLALCLYNLHSFLLKKFKQILNFRMKTDEKITKSWAKATGVDETDAL